MHELLSDKFKDHTAFLAFSRNAGVVARIADLYDISLRSEPICGTDYSRSSRTGMRKSVSHSEFCADVELAARKHGNYIASLFKLYSAGGMLKKEAMTLLVNTLGPEFIERKLSAYFRRSRKSGPDKLAPLPATVPKPTDGAFASWLSRAICNDVVGLKSIDGLRQEWIERRATV